MSGLSSICVTFDYNPYIVDSLKAIPTFYYHKPSLKNNNTPTWEVPVCYLSRLLDSLTFYDDIQLSLLDTPKSEEFYIGSFTSLPAISSEELASFKAQPFEHQVEAINYGLSHGKWLRIIKGGEFYESFYGWKTNSWFR